jgi:hypothetical protein
MEIQPGRFRRFRWQAVGALAALSVAAVVVAAVLAGTAHSNSRTAIPLDAVTNAGTFDVTSILTPADQASIERVSTGHEGQPAPASLTGLVLRLRSSGGRAFYRLQNAKGPDCFASGPSVGVGYLLGIVLCAPDFPSLGLPVMDMTYLSDHRDGSVYVIRSQGIAADGIASMSLEDLEGNVVAETPVVANTYLFDESPTLPVGALVAYDAAGKELWSRMYS